MTFIIVEKHVFQNWRFFSMHSIKYGGVINVAAVCEINIVSVS